MIYLPDFTFPDRDQEFDRILLVKRRCYTTYYPFGILSKIGLSDLRLDTITILYGGNGCGKSTALNIIAEKLGLQRETPCNRSDFFDAYTELCCCRTAPEDLPERSRIITSDDVFDYMLNIRSINEGIDRKRQEIFADYLDAKYADFHYRSLEDYDRLKQVNAARRCTQSSYTRKNLMDNIRELSNGESAFRYFTEKITENALYLLDEPENSLAPHRQRELADFLQDAARFYNCQFLIATHSPFLLALKNARIYDLDAGASVRNWTKLTGVRDYYEFFREHEKEF